MFEIYLEKSVIEFKMSETKLENSENELKMSGLYLDSLKLTLKGLK